MTKHIKSIIETIITDQGNWKLQLLTQWPTIMGNVKTKVNLEKINNDSLVLGVTDSCWLQELYMLSPLLIEAINKKLDYPRIKTLRFKKTGVTKRVQKKERSGTQPRYLKQITILPHEHKALTCIKDPDLQKALENFLRRCKQEQ